MPRRQAWPAALLVPLPARRRLRDTKSALEAFQAATVTALSASLAHEWPIYEHAVDLALARIERHLDLRARSHS